MVSSNGQQAVDCSHPRRSYGLRVVKEVGQFDLSRTAAMVPAGKLRFQAKADLACRAAVTA